MGSTTLARGNIDQEKLFSISITPVAVAANITAEQSFTVLGISVGDYINIASASAQTAGILIGNVRVSAANTLTVQFANITSGSLTPVAGTYGVIWGSPENLPLDSNAL